MGALILNTWKSHANGLRNEDAVVPAGLGSTAGLWYGNNREYRDHSGVPLPAILLKAISVAMTEACTDGVICGKKSSRSIEEMELAQQAVYSKKKKVEMRIVIEELQLELRRMDKLRVSRAAAAEMKTQLLEHTNSVTGKKAKLLLLKFLLHRVNYITLQCVRNEASQESITQLKVDSNEAI
ncbi:hypothetical protein WN944_014950 [Citrus x changshan-huyou]|uniref:Uncharacterized protein n=1 Tax=Citrus x changshan-huyou TaxID=2935761 RepID=A0AAP0M836_9ROSI